MGIGFAVWRIGVFGRNFNCPTLLVNGGVMFLGNPPATGIFTGCGFWAAPILGLVVALAGGVLRAALPTALDVRNNPINLKRFDEPFGRLSVIS